MRFKLFSRLRVRSFRIFRKIHGYILVLDGRKEFFDDIGGGDLKA